MHSLFAPGARGAAVIRARLRRAFARRLRRHSPAALALLLSACGLARCTPEPLEGAALEAVYATPLAPPEGGLSVFHLGHSLVGRDMPAMLEQLAGAGHRHASQLGWGTPLRAHWEPDVEIKGFGPENDHPRHRAAGAALDSGAHDAVVLTEMVEIRDAIEYHDSWDYLHRWAARARAGNPDVRVYLYETWPHRTGDDAAWLARLDRDLERYWKRAILHRALAADAEHRPVYLIPAGQVMARLAREIAARGGVGGLETIGDLFVDDIHVNDLGAYLVALTHYAVLYHRSPEGLPHRLRRADGSAATAPAPETARLMQRVVQDVVTSHRATGLAAAQPEGTDP